MTVYIVTEADSDQSIKGVFSSYEKAWQWIQTSGKINELNQLSVQYLIYEEELQ